MAREDREVEGDGRVLEAGDRAGLRVADHDSDKLRRRPGVPGGIARAAPSTRSIISSPPSWAADTKQSPLVREVGIERRPRHLGPPDEVRDGDRRAQEELAELHAGPVPGAPDGA